MGIIATTGVTPYILWGLFFPSRRSPPSHLEKHETGATDSRNDGTARPRCIVVVIVVDVVVVVVVVFAWNRFFYPAALVGTPSSVRHGVFIL